MLFLSDHLEKKFPGRIPSSESDALTSVLQRTTGPLQPPLSEPMQWTSDLSSEVDLEGMEVGNYCWRSYLILPKAKGRGLQFALPLRSSWLGSATEHWWEFATIYPVITQPQYYLDSPTSVPAHLSSAITSAESILCPAVLQVPLTQQHTLSKAKTRYILTSAVLLLALVVLGLAGALVDAEVTVVGVYIAVLLEGWCVGSICVISASIRKSHLELRCSLEAFCQSKAGLKDYSVRVAGPYYLQFQPLPSVP